MNGGGAAIRIWNARLSRPSLHAPNRVAVVLEEPGTSPTEICPHGRDRWVSVKSSLADFARIVETFEAAGTSFVSGRSPFLTVGIPCLDGRNSLIIKTGFHGILIP